MRERGESGEGVIFRDASFLFVTLVLGFALLTIVLSDPAGRGFQNAASSAGAPAGSGGADAVVSDMNRPVKAPRDVPVG